MLAGGSDRKASQRRAAVTSGGAAVGLSSAHRESQGAGIYRGHGPRPGRLIGNVMNLDFWCGGKRPWVRSWSSDSALHALLHEARIASAACYSIINLDYDYNRQPMFSHTELFRVGQAKYDMSCLQHAQAVSQHAARHTQAKADVQPKDRECFLNGQEKIRETTVLAW